MNDDKLIRLILHKQDRAAANTLVERYYDEIYRYAYRQSLNDSDPKNTAMDLTQEIFISMLRSLATFNPKKAAFRTWLYQVASSRIIDQKRKFAPNEIQIDEAVLFDETDFTNELANKELIEKIELHINRLPSDIQKILRLHLYAEMSFEEIARTMAISESTVKSKYYRTIKHIREVFQDEYSYAE
jgi:RNA polymerase sigma-70 factor (ECF subfamily)